MLAAFDWLNLSFLPEANKAPVTKSVTDEACDTVQSSEHLLDTKSKEKRKILLLMRYLFMRRKYLNFLVT